MLDLNQGQFVKHILLHPFEGFEDMRWKKSGSMKIAVGFVCALFFQQFAYARLYGFQYYSDYDKIFNIVPYIVSSFVLFGTWVTANWAMCTLFDGEGSMRNIFIYSAYALVPYIAGYLTGTALSHLFVRDEYVFIRLIQTAGFIWSFVLMISAIKSVHQFTLGKTVALILLTVAAMAAMLFLLVLLLTLIQQMLIFVFSIFTEIFYRLRV